jgi:hypothetical protein
MNNTSAPTSTPLPPTTINSSSSSGSNVSQNSTLEGAGIPSKISNSSSMDVIGGIYTTAATSMNPNGSVSVTNLNPQPTQSVKKTSFQITSVTVDSSASNDGADESGDELDESHTEDSSDMQTGKSHF